MPLPEMPRLTGNAWGDWIIRPMCQGPGVRVVAKVPCEGPVPPPSIEVTPLISAMLDLLRTDEMNVAVEPAGGEDLAFACDHVGAGADHDGDAGLNIGIAGLAYPQRSCYRQVCDMLAFPTNAPVVNDQRIGDDGIGRALSVGDLRMPHETSRITLPPPNFTSSP